MKVRDIIKLANNEKYTLISSCVYENKTYFLAIGFKNEKEVDLKKLVVFEEIPDKGVKMVTDREQLIKLTTILHDAMK